MRLLLDEMVSSDVAEQLRAAGCDCVAVTEDVALRGRGDADLFDLAQGAGRVVVTYNRDDYLELHRLYVSEGKEHKGLVIVHPRRFPPREIARLARALQSFVEHFTPQPSFLTWLQVPG